MPAWITTVRTDAAARLAAAGTGASSRVFDSRSKPITVTADQGATVDTLPLLIVRTGPLKREAKGHSKGSVVESAELIVEGYVLGAAGGSVATLAANTDTLEEQSHVALWCNAAWLALYKKGGAADGAGLEFVSSSAKVIDAETGYRVGTFRTVYLVSRFAERTATSGANALETLVGTFKLIDDDGDLTLTAATTQLDDLDA